MCTLGSLTWMSESEYTYEWVMSFVYVYMNSCVYVYMGHVVCICIYEK